MWVKQAGLQPAIRCAIESMNMNLLFPAVLGTVLVVALNRPVSASAADAKTNWKSHCAKCHADDGSGNTGTGRKLHVRDYRDPKVQAKLTERDMIKATRGGLKDNGREVMKPFGGTLSDEEIRDLITHIRGFEKKN